MNDLNVLLGVLMAVAFVVNIIVQLTKNIVPLPTKLWVILVSASISLIALYVGGCLGYVKLSGASIALSVVGSFIVAYVAMYGFDTLKELWTRFKEGKNIYDNN